MHGRRQAIAHSVRLCVDGCANEIALDPDKDRSEVETSEHFLVGGCEIGVGDWSRAGNDAADKASNGAYLLHVPYRSGIEQRSRVYEIVPEPSGKWLIRETMEGARQFRMTEWLDQVGDMQPKKADEQRVFLFGSDWLAFIDGIADREMDISWTSFSHSPARCDCDALHRDFATLGGDVDPPSLRPRSI